MDSYGAILRHAREEKKISIETAAKETSITQHYLEALESENTEVFHGEAYVVGFLRNYAEYLNVDAARLTKLYHAALVQEAPVPEGLFEKPKPTYFVPAIVTSSIIVVTTVTLLILYFTVYRPKQIAKQNEYAVSNKVQQKTYELDSKPLNERLYVGDQIVVPSHDGNIMLTVASDTDSRLGLQTPVGLQYFDLSETRELDIDGDSAVDLVIDVWEVSSNKNSRGAEVYIMLKDGSAVTENVDETSIPLLASQQADQTIILEDNRAYPFTLNASFRNPCVFRYEVDRKDSVENYYTNGDAVTMTANNKTRVWISNGNTVKFQVIAGGRAQDLEIAKAGEVVVEDIKWIRTDEGRYRLVVEGLD
ncbi:MAG: helix-turn-helix domain-containing protein [Treponema sp.]|nr:helix-turn-helix domain-containing protein [Treponema sp.]